MIKSFSTIVLHPQRFVDGIGMYRLVSSALMILTAISIMAGQFGLLAYPPVNQLLAVVTAVVLALVLNVSTLR